MAAKAPEPPTGDANGTHSIDPNSGFCKETKIFHSLRPSAPLPPPNQPLSIAQLVFSLLHSSATDLTTDIFLVNSATGYSLTYAQFISQVRSLSLALSAHYSLSTNDVAFILCPTSVHLPILYFSLISLGVIISPANPLSSKSEVTHQLQLCKPKIAFATSQTAHKLPSLPLGTILIDSPAFLALLTRSKVTTHDRLNPVVVKQSDTAAILYSSGTTGRVKGVALTHRNLIALISGFYQNNKVDPNEPGPHPVSLFTLPMFHVYGFIMLISAVAVGFTVVLMERFDFEGMLRAVEKYKVNYMPVSPPLIVAFVKSELINRYDLSSLLMLACGGAPLGKDVADKFKEKFPHVDIIQVGAYWDAFIFEILVLLGLGTRPY